VSGVSITAQTATRVSNALPFNVVVPVFSLTSLSPASAVAGGPQFTLTVNGAAFTNGTTVFWNGNPLVTSFISTNQLNAIVPAILIAAVGSASVTANSNGVVSNALPFAITQTGNVLTLTSVSPTSVVASGPQFTLTVNG
jgi:hypothetical protein